MSESGIYKIVNRINGKMYIGSSKDLATRERRHFRELDRNYHFNKHLQRAFNKYGCDNFIFSIILFCEESLMLGIETSIISLYRFDNLYNIAKDALAPMKGRRFSDDHKRKLAKSKIGKSNPMYGVKGKLHPRYGVSHSEETKKKLSTILMGRVLSKETRRKMSESRRGNKHWNYGNTGKKSPLYGGKNPCAKSVEQIELVTGNIINIYDCVATASRETGANKSSISMCISNKRKSSGGFGWRLVNVRNIQD